MRHIFTLVFALVSFSWAYAQPPCPNDDLSLVVTILTDNYGYEISWVVVGEDGEIYGSIPANTLANNQFYQTQVCIPADACVEFVMADTYGDGLLGSAYFMLTLEGDTVLYDPPYTSVYSFSTNCAPGQTCEGAIPVQLGQYTTSFDDHWYVFTPDSVGTYLISTCGLADCDTKIWVYETCVNNGQAEDNAGTYFFDDNDSECAPQAMVQAFLSDQESYYIRIGDNLDACADSITWEIVYLGPVIGCTDPASCNYNPLASIDDGSCLPQGDPNCPDAPDLLIRQDILANTLQLGTYNSTDPCLIEEGCVRGYGLRNLVRFSTHIANIGQKDYYIGMPSNANSQFTWNNCHNHFHYDGYAEYILFDADGTRLPAGFKNGFCVLDLGCTWGSAKFGCGNMGITAGCYDEYWSGLGCQWIDVTDVPDGTYTFVTRVNWDNAPDALGQVERDTLNNWAQVCITLDRSSGQLQMTSDPDCAIYVDCTGQPYGSAQPDCTGECNGSAIRGDLNANGLQEMVDAEEYVLSIISDDIESTPCNDLNGDGAITVYDASLLASCLNFGNTHLHPGETGNHDHCNFPSGVVNILDTTTLTILNVDFAEQFVDIGIKNPGSRVNAYQFVTSGMALAAIDNLVDPAVFPISPRFSMSDSMVIGISYQDSMVQRSNEFQPLCRIYFSDVTADYLCLENVIEVINQYQEQTIVRIENGCVERLVNTSSADLLRPQVKLAPNPTSGSALLSFPNPGHEALRLTLADAAGRVVRTYTGLTGVEVTIERGQLPAGVYTYRLSGSQSLATGKLVMQ